MTAPIDYFGTGRDAGDNSFLSNFSDVPGGVLYAGLSYATVEHAYQAAKTTDLDLRKQIQEAPGPKEAKRLGRQLKLRVGWERAKLDVMHVLLERKFESAYMARLLIVTAPAELIEGNWWHDNYWGDCRCKKRQQCEATGKNMLGELLMSVRCAVQREYTIDPLDALRQ